MAPWDPAIKMLERKVAEARGIGGLKSERDLAQFIKRVLAQDTQATRAQLAMMFVGTGTPEGVVTAPVGSIYQRKDGGAGTSIYIKQSGAGNTGWVGK